MSIESREVFKKFNIPLEKARKYRFDYTDYKYVFRIPIDRVMEIEYINLGILEG